MRALHLTLSFAVSLAVCAVAHAQIVGDKVKIGVLTDLSGRLRRRLGRGRQDGRRGVWLENQWQADRGSRR